MSLVIILIPFLPSYPYLSKTLLRKSSSSAALLFFLLFPTNIPFFLFSSIWARVSLSSSAACYSLATLASSLAYSFFLYLSDFLYTLSFSSLSYLSINLSTSSTDFLVGSSSSFACSISVSFVGSSTWVSALAAGAAALGDCSFSAASIAAWVASTAPSPVVSSVAS